VNEERERERERERREVGRKGRKREIKKEDRRKRKRVAERVVLTASGDERRPTILNERALNAENRGPVRNWHTRTSFLFEIKEKETCDSIIRAGLLSGAFPRCWIYPFGPTLG